MHYLKILQLQRMCTISVRWRRVEHLQNDTDKGKLK